MSFNFNDSQWLTTTDDVYNCFLAWSIKYPPLFCEREDPYLKITLADKQEILILKITDVFAMHAYEPLQDRSVTPLLESKNYSLAVWGQETHGKVIQFRLNMSTKTLDHGETWSVPKFLFWINSSESI